MSSPAEAIMLGNGGLSEGLFNAYTLSEYGSWQADQPLRYESAYGCYDREQMLDDIGPDADPNLHMPVTRRSLLSVVAYEGNTIFWSPADVAVGEAAAILHDIGECTAPSLIDICGGVVGDIPFGEKKDEDRALEARVRQFMYRFHFPGLADSLIERIELLISHQEASPIHQAIEAAHDTNSLIVGLRSGRIALGALYEGEVFDDRLKQLRIMAVDVTSKIVDRVVSHAAAFTYPKLIWDRSEKLYEQIHSELA